MDNKTFNSECRRLNQLYFGIFGYIPCSQDYSCSRETYIAAMEKAIQIKK